MQGKAAKKTIQLAGRAAGASPNACTSDRPAEHNHCPGTSDWPAKRSHCPGFVGSPGVPVVAHNAADYVAIRQYDASVNCGTNGIIPGGAVSAPGAEVAREATEVACESARLSIGCVP